MAATPTLGTPQPKWLGKPVFKSVWGPVWVVWTTPDGRWMVDFALADTGVSEFIFLSPAGGTETLPFEKADNVAFAESFWPEIPALVS